MIFKTYQVTLQKEPPPLRWEPREEEQPKPLPPSNLVATLVKRLNQQQVTS